MIKQDSYVFSYSYGEVKNIMTLQKNKVISEIVTGVMDVKYETLQPCYDFKGNEIGIFKDSKRLRRQCSFKCNELKNTYQSSVEVIQYNYDFFLMNISQKNIRGTKDCLHFIRDRIKIYFKDFKQPSIGISYNSYKKKYERSNIPLEICSRYLDVHNSSRGYKRFIDFDIKKYDKNLHSFIKLHPNHSESAKVVHSLNIEYICNYYGVTERQLRDKRFNRLTHAIKILNNKINNKKI
tara:strand:- start:335 stop:1045 length:711 start_codon:yes stop_codon:yes gene_type:complete